jgi:hypothetical protein
MTPDELDASGGLTPERLADIDAWVRPRVVPEMEDGMLLDLLAIRLLPETVACRCASSRDQPDAHRCGC